MSDHEATMFDLTAMRARRNDYYRFVRGSSRDLFNPDGSYRPNMDPDRRATYWIFPALIDTDDPAERAFALRLLENDPCWSGWNIFTSSSIASILVRERTRLTPELICRAETHLDRFVDAGAARVGSSGANDYMFHGYNDNMPAMASRALIFAGEALGRRELLEHGLFLLEATGLDPALAELLPGGRRIRQRRLYWRRDFVGTPFYDAVKQHRLAVDRPGAESGAW